MKLKFRFGLFFTVGLIAFILYLGLVMLFLFDLVLPSVGIGNDDNSGAFLFVFAFSFLSGGCFFSEFFVYPLVFILSITERLSLGEYNISDMEQKLYNSKGKLKKRYRLYKMAIDNLRSLSVALQSAKAEHEELAEAKKKWISGISHDLKTPLSYIVGYSALLTNKDYSFDENERQSYLSQIYVKGKYMEELIGDLNLSFKLTDSDMVVNITPTSFNLVRFIQELTADVASLPSADGYHFSFEAEKKEIAINADAKLLYRAFQNILVNAVKHNPIGINIEVNIKLIDNRMVMIEISDDGTGFTKEEAASIFDRYTKVSEESGLGLSIVKDIIKAHGGNIYAESKSVAGSTFYITLPYDKSNEILFT